MPKSRLLPRALLTAALLLFTVFNLVNAFAEEDIVFYDPYVTPDGSPFPGRTDDEVSSIHNDLTYILALAAGFTDDDARTLQIYNQLVDSEMLGPDDTATYSLCSGSFQPTPATDAAALGCPPDTDFSSVAWPMWGDVQGKDPGSACFTSRFGPYSPFFHYPHNDPQELEALAKWGWGVSPTLSGYAAYAWDGATVLQSRCAVKKPEVIDTGDVHAGSLQAFAIYLHSYADYHSHRDCMAALDALQPPAPWGTHTLNLNPDESLYACGYNPLHHTNTDSHGREFGNNYPADSARTDAAIQAVYAELTRRSLAREGMYGPVRMDTLITVGDSQVTFQQALYNFVHNNLYSEALERRYYGSQVLAGVQALARQPVKKMYAPLLRSQ